MTSDLRLRQEVEWQTLNAKIDALMLQFGREDALGAGDFWLLDENWGRFRQEIEVQNLALLRPAIIRQLRALLVDFPDWDITVRVDAPDGRGKWPGMGIVISSHGISDELLREYLPPEFGDIAYD